MTDLNDTDTPESTPRQIPFDCRMIARGAAAAGGPGSRVGAAHLVTGKTQNPIFSPCRLSDVAVDFLTWHPLDAILMAV